MSEFNRQTHRRRCRYWVAPRLGLRHRTGRHAYHWESEAVQIQTQEASGGRCWEIYTVNKGLV
jgi:hypothetical protein